MACAILVLIGALAGYFVVPMNALLQHRGHVLLSAGHSIAVQNFNENPSILVMLGLYALLIWLNLPIQAVMLLFGLFVAISMVLVLLRHRYNQRQFDSVALIGEVRRTRIRSATQADASAWYAQRQRSAQDFALSLRFRSR